MDFAVPCGGEKPNLLIACIGDLSLEAEGNATCANMWAGCGLLSFCSSGYKSVARL